MTQDITSVGYHYYMTPETAELGLSKLSSATSSKQWNYTDYPYLPDFNVFKTTTSKDTTSNYTKLQRQTTSSKHE